MKLERKTIELETSGMMQVSKAKIKATAKVFSMFEDGTYTNKPVTILRELVANGIDSHIMAGTPNRPVEVKLPTEADPTFSVRDFGIGMAHDFVVGPFMEYANGSTKEGTDEVIGGFGIGSKSPFSYVDQYTLRVVHDSVLSIYTMFKDEDGIPAVGLVAQTTTDEPNGVEVSFPVMENDVDAFRAAAQTALQYFRPLPLVENGTLNAPDYTYSGNNWGLRASAGDLGIIMGGVRYPVTTASLEYKLQTDPNIGPLLKYGIDLTLPLGAVAIAMSREGLSYGDKTNKGIREGLEAVVNDVVATFANMFDNEPTVWKAMVRLAEETGGTNSYSQNARQQLLAANAYYKGVKLEHKVSIENMTGFKSWEVPRSSHSRRKTTQSPTWRSPRDERHYFPGEIETVIIDDLPDTPKSKTMLRLRTYLESKTRSKNTVVLRTDSRDGYDKVLAMIGGPDFITTSSLPVPVTTAKAAKVANVRPHVRMFSYDGQSNRSGDKPMLIQPAAGRYGVKEIKYVDQPDTGIMVVMNSFAVPDKFYESMATGLVKYDEINFVNVGDWEKLDHAKWQKFETVFAARLANELIKYSDLPAKKAIREDKNLSVMFELFREIESNMKAPIVLTSAQLKRPFGRAYELYTKYVSTMTSEEIALLAFVTAKMPRGVNGEALVKAFRTEQADFHTMIRLTCDAWQAKPKHIAIALKMA